MYHILNFVYYLLNFVDGIDVANATFLLCEICNFFGV